MARTRSRRRRDATPHEAGPPWLERAWATIASPLTVGGLITLAGVVLIAAPFVQFPTRWSARWWVSAHSATDVVMLVATLLVVALIWAVALFWKRYFEPAERVEPVEVTLTERPALSPSSLDELAPRVGLGLMVAGAALATGTWFSAHARTPAMEVGIPIGQVAEFVNARVGARTLRVMLPRRVEITDLSFTRDPHVTLKLTRPKETDAQPRTLTPGEQLEVDGVRLTFLGVRDDPKALRGVFKGADARSIETAAREGQDVKVMLNGPSWKVLRIVQSYPKFLGPAAQLESEQSGRFWVFLRDQKNTLNLPVRLVRVQTLPAAVFTMAPVVPFWPLLASGLLLALGLGLFMMGPEIVLRRRPDGSWALWSLNEAGPLAEAVAVEPRALPQFEAREDDVVSAQPHTKLITGIMAGVGAATLASASDDAQEEA